MFRRSETPIVRLRKSIKRYLNQQSKFIKTILLMIIVIISIVLLNLKENRIRVNLINTSYELYGYSSQIVNTLYNRLNEISFCKSERLYDPEIYRENKYLKIQNSTLNEQIKLLKSKITLIDNRNYTYVTAMITQVTYPQDEVAWVLSAGEKNGVSIGNIVLDEDGVVGRISTVTNNYSLVSLIGNDNVKISAIVLPSGQDAIVGRRFDPYHLELNYISDLGQIHDGDHVMTSGQDGLNPYGISLGVIRMLNSKPFIVVEQRFTINTIVKIITNQSPS